MAYQNACNEVICQIGPREFDLCVLTAMTELGRLPSPGELPRHGLPAEAFRRLTANDTKSLLRVVTSIREPSAVLPTAAGVYAFFTTVLDLVKEGGDSQDREFNHLMNMLTILTLAVFEEAVAAELRIRVPNNWWLAPETWDPIDGLDPAAEARFRGLE